MGSPKQVLKGIGPKLVLFFKTVAIYFVVFIPQTQPSIYAAVLKCLPILSLIGFVLMHGMSLGDEYAYSRRILLGLIFSAIGDILLVWPETFLHGLLSFLVTQLFYISAFGFQPLKLWLASAFLAVLVSGLSVIISFIEGPLVFAVCAYGTILMTMVWRGVAMVQFYEELCTWTKLCSCVGGILFAISDISICLDEFVTKLPHSQVIIMTTYYAAQFFISLSVVDSKASYLDKQNDIKKKVEMKS